MLILIARTLCTYFIIGLLLAIVLPPCFVIALLPVRYRYDNRLFYYLLYILYRGTVYASLNPVKIYGNKYVGDEPVIFVANHQSAFDIPMVGSLCRGYPHVWLVLAYYLNAPVLGFFVRRMFVPVDQENTAGAALSLRTVMKRLAKRDRHLLIFPEGGRFNDGTIHPFFEGFALVAQQTGLPVVPVYMPNNGRLYPPGSFFVYSGTIETYIGEPMSMHEHESLETFTARVRDWFVWKNSENSP